MVVVNQTVWLTTSSPRPHGHGRLLRVDATSGRVRTFRLAGNPWSIAYGFGSLWITGEGGGFDGAVIRIDPRSGRVLRVIRGPKRFGSALGVTSNGVWIGGGDIVPFRHPNDTVARWVFKIDPRRNAVTRSVRLSAATVIALAGDGPSLWATGWGAVVKLSPSGRVRSQRRMDGAGWSIAPAPGGVWVARPFFGTRSSRQAFPARQLVRVRTSARRPTVVALGGQPADVAVAGGAAWAVAGDWRGGGRLDVVRVDESGAATIVPVRGMPGMIAAARNAVWLAAQQPNELSKIC